MKSLQVMWGGMKSAGLAMWNFLGLTGTRVVAKTIAAAETKAKVAKEMSCTIVRDIKEVGSS
jgi:hypothetical protein